MSIEQADAGAALGRMKSELKRLTPAAWWQRLTAARSKARLIRYRAIGRPVSSGETLKARERRIRDGFFEKYCVGIGLDIGYGGDLLCDSCVGWDIEHGDAQRLESIVDQTFDFVYSSHTLEHLADPSEALRNWFRVVRATGYLIIFLPDRDLYEKKSTLPSRWNPDHKHFFLLDRDQPPDTIGVLRLIKRILPEAEIVSARRCDEDHTIVDPQVHSDGEYSIEVILRKPA